MNERNKAFLAAMLAVKRGLLDADAAVELLAEIDKDDAAAKPDAVAPALSIACASIASPALEAEVEAIVADPIVAQRTLIELGCDGPLAQSLVEFGASISPDHMRRTLFRASEGATTRTFNTTTLTSLVDRERYEMRREHGRGGMGVVYLAFDKSLDREVAYKRLLPRKASSGRHSPMTPASNPAETVERFLREAKVTGQLEHPNIIPVYEIGERDQGEVYYTMKFVRGRSMADRLREIQGDGALSDAEKLTERLKLIDAFVDVCNAVAYAHSKGVIHRDLKPDNIMLGGFGETLLVDWGLAHVRGEHDSLPAQANLSIAGSGSDNESSNSRLTMDGAVIGTPAYMSPEQAKGELADVDERSDVYSLGAILYEIISGQAPIQGRSIQKLLASASLGERRNLRELVPNAPGELVAIVDYAMQLVPEKRPQDADALASEVIAWRDGGRVSAYEYSSWELLKRFAKRNRAALVAATVLVVAVLGFLFVDHWQEEEAFQQALAERRQEIDDYYSRYQSLQPDELLKGADSEVAALLGRETSLLEVRSGTPEQRRMIDRLLDAAHAAEELVEHGVEPVGDRRVNDLLPVAADVLHARELELRDRAARLAAGTGGWDLAERIIGDSPVSDEVKQELRSFVEKQRGRRLAQRKQRIEFALDDVRQGLGRVGRDIDGLRLSEYVNEIATYQDEQTVDLLAAELMALRNEVVMDTPDRSPSESHVWTLPQTDMLQLCTEVLGRIGLQEHALASFSAAADGVSDRTFLEYVISGIGSLRNAGSIPVLFSIREYAPDMTYVVDRALATTPVVKPLSGSNWNDHFNYALHLEARKEYEEAVRVFTVLIEQDPDEHAYWGNRARVLGYMGRGEEAESDARRAIEIDPTRDVYWNLLGRALFRRGDDVNALEAFQKVLEITPSSSNAHEMKALIYIRQERYEEALRDIDMALGLSPQSALALNSRALVLARSGKYEQALADYTKAIAIDNANETYHANRGKTYADIGEFDLAVQDLRKALDLNPRVGSIYSKLGALYANNNQLKNAIEVYNTGIKHCSDDAGIYSNRGDALSLMGRYQEAIEDFTKSIELYKRLQSQGVVVESRILHVPYRNRGVNYRNLRQYELALADIEVALAIRPDDIDLLKLRADILQSLGRPVDKEALYAEHSARKEDSETYYRTMAVLALELKKYDEARDHFGNAIRFNPRGYIYYHNRALMRHYLKDYEGAVADYTAALLIKPDNGISFYNRGMSNAAQGHYQSALEDYAQAEACENRSFDLASLSLRRGEACMALGDLDASAKAYERAVELGAEAHSTYNSIGMAYMRVNKPLDAEAWWTKAIEAKPDFDTALNNRGFARWKQGKHEAGLEDYRKCFELVPTGKSAFRAAFLAALASADRQAQDPSDQLAGTLIDEAFTWLDKAIELGHSELASVETNKDFTALHADPRWVKCVERIKANAEKAPDGK